MEYKKDERKLIFKRTILDFAGVDAMCDTISFKGPLWTLLIWYILGKLF